MITEQQKIEIKEYAAMKPIKYQDPVPLNKLKNDCASYARNVFPEWNVSQIVYFYEMVKSYTKVANENTNVH